MYTSTDVVRKAVRKELRNMKPKMTLEMVNQITSITPRGVYPKTLEIEARVHPWYNKLLGEKVAE